MRKRPCMFVCLIFLLIKMMILVMNGGQSFVKLPVGSVFREMEDGQECLIQGQVYQKTNTSKVQILYLKNNSIYYQKHSFYESKIIIYDKTFQEIAIGKTVRVRGMLNELEEARNPGNFDRKLFYAEQNIYGSVQSTGIESVTGREDFFRETLWQIKERWKNVINEAIGEKNGAVLSAMLLGVKSEMDTEIKELYQKNGIGHILAISGLHISFIGLGVYKLIRKTGCPFVPAGLVSVLILSIYTCMIGFSVSVLRAYIMLLLRVGADMSGRVCDMATGLSLAGAITVLYQPLYLFDAGFLMSYGAILGILLISPAVEMLFPCKYKFLAGLYAGVSIQLMLFPILLFFYFEFPVYSFLLNMAVIPLMSVVLGLGIFGSGSFLLWKPLGVLLLKGCGFLLEFFEYLSRACSMLPGARVVFGKPLWWQIAVYYVVLSVLLCGFYRCQRILHVHYDIEKRKDFRRIRCCICLAGSLLVFLFLLGHGKFAGMIGKGTITVTVMDVGQGDGIFIRGPGGSTYLIDGGSSDVKEVGKYRIEPFLKSQGVGKLDYVFVSHGDSDHMNGIRELILRKNIGVTIENLVLPINYQEDEALYELAVFAKTKGVRTLVMEEGNVLREKEMTISCIQPGSSDMSLEGNAGSMVLDIQFREFDMLCTGDVEAEGEEKLIENLTGRQYDVLKVSHHGSKNSTSEKFLTCVQPKIAVISAGRKNRYGHPHKETLERLQESGAVIYNTQKNGAVTLTSDGGKVNHAFGLT